jgi:hypothetical protein
VVPLIAELPGHAPGAPLVAIVQAGDARPAHNPCQQAHHVLGGEVTPGEHLSRLVLKRSLPGQELIAGRR